MGTVQSGSGLSDCTDFTGRGVTGATLGGSLDVEGVCSSHSPGEEWGRGTGQLSWSDGSVSDYSAVLVGEIPVRADIKITGGRWAGATASLPMFSTGGVGTCGGGVTESVIEGGPLVLHPAGSVSSSPLLGVEKIDAGASHTCALVDGGTAKCWGSNSNGQIGDGSTTSSDLPVEVVGLSGATSISAGNTQTCAVLAGGTVSCWGFGSLTPTQVQGISGATAVSVGDEPNLFYHGPYACALVSGGQVMCWGNNDSGQLGDGTTVSSSTPVSVVGIAGATAVGAGPYASTCAVVAGGVECWGSNTWGELGDGTTSVYSTVPVSAVGVSGATDAGQGARHACAEISDGSAMCWGNNDYGQLGNGANLAVNLPAPVTGLTDATSMSVGYDHTCAVRAGGSAVCWGRNNGGQLGTGNLSDAATPVAVIGGF